MAAPKLAVVVPTLNAGPQWAEWLAAWRRQTLVADRVVVVDSSSTDATAELARDAGFEVVTIPRAEFSHGATRQWAIESLPAEIELVVLATQDAIAADAHALAELAAAFEDPGVGAAYGRQLPRHGAGPIEAHARLFNYPEHGMVKSLGDAPALGIKTAFISNSFAAYRRSALDAVGGFPRKVIVSEDTWVSARMLLAGWKIAYRSGARVFHSHGYSPWQDLQRYFDIGVFHAANPWIMAAFGKAEGEGRRFVESELRHLLRAAPALIPSAILRTGLKYLGYRLGRREAGLPGWLKTRMSMHPGYWAAAGRAGAR
jgi:rhamnosyltransferase